MEKREIFSNQKIFRQNSSLVKPLLSRNFCQKCARLNCSNFHIVTQCLHNVCIAFLGNYEVSDKHSLKSNIELNVFSVDFTKYFSVTVNCGKGYNLFSRIFRKNLRKPYLNINYKNDFTKYFF